MSELISFNNLCERNCWWKKILTLLKPEKYFFIITRSKMISERIFSEYHFFLIKLKWFVWTSSCDFFLSIFNFFLTHHLYRWRSQKKNLNEKWINESFFRGEKLLRASIMDGDKWYDCIGFMNSMRR